MIHIIRITTFKLKLLVKKFRHYRFLLANIDVRKVPKELRLAKNFGYRIKMTTIENFLPKCPE